MTNSSKKWIMQIFQKKINAILAQTRNNSSVHCRTCKVDCSPQCMRFNHDPSAELEAYVKRLFKDMNNKSL
jgi:hypothetical protein